MSYLAPVKDMLFCMKELAGLEGVAADGEVGGNVARAQLAAHAGAE